MERKVGEVFNDGNDIIKVELGNGWAQEDCRDCYYGDKGIKRCRGNSLNHLCGSCHRKDKRDVKFIKIGQVKNIDLGNDWADCFRYFVEGLKNIKGESKMDNKEELKRSLAEEKQRVKDSLANVEKMEKQLEELNKKEEQPTVSATGVYLIHKDNKKGFYLYNDQSITENNISSGTYNDIRLKMNVFFETKEQAEQEALRREGQEFIRRKAMEWNKDHDWRTDMSAETEYMYYIGYGFRSKLFVNKTESFVTVGTICFDNQELAQKCIAELKAKYNEEQIKTIFGVI